MKFDLRTILLFFCAAGLAQSAAAASPEPDEGHQAAPLALTPTEYNNTVADLLGFPRDGEQWPKRPSVADRLSPRRTASKGVFSPPPPPDPWPWPFPAEPGSDGFEGIAQGQSPSSYQVEELHLAGMHFGAFALLSPTFFDLWDSMPDEELFRAAGTGELETAEGVERQARRMLDDPKARPAVVHFHHQWLGTDQVLLIAPARRAFGPRFGISRTLRNARDDDTKWPAIMGPIRHSLRLETELFVEEAIFDRAGTFTELMTGTHGYMSRNTSPIYGATTTPDEGRTAVTRQIEYVSVSVGRKKPLTLDPVVLDPTQRAGVLTLPSVLAIGAYAVQPGPIPRGVRILERVACMEMGDPIEGVESALPPDALGVESTNRQRTAAATKPRECNSCHRRINPAGFAFEHYDAMGAWRAVDNGLPVDASGSLRLPGAEELTFDDGVEFAHELAASRRVRDCYALHWTRYALGSHLDRTAPSLQPIQQSFRDNDSIKELLVSIATSDLFRQGGTG